MYNKILFVHFPHVNNGGLPIIDERNRIALMTLTSNLVNISLHPFSCSSTNCWVRIFSKFKMLCGKPLQNSSILYDELETGNVMLFFSHSSYGLLIKEIRRKYPALRVVSFFHNVESEYYKKNLGVCFNLGDCFRYILYKKIEANTVRYADKLIVLNNRDRILLSRIYGVEHSFVFPTTIKDRFNLSSKKSLNENYPLVSLFVGTLFPSNEQGVMWLAEKISPFVNVQINIVGMHMEQLAPQLKGYKNIKVVGEVDPETLDMYYYEADVFISTLFIGGGMKTKIAEAMMFALPIIATEESFQGYNLDYSKIGLKSDIPQEIIMFINSLNKNRKLLKEYSKNSRLQYLKYYSYECSCDYLNKIL